MTIGRGTKLWKMTRKYREDIREGNILCIDPSCGSLSSMPGYAIFSCGELKDYGIIEIENVGGELPLRLFELGECLRNDFEIPDVLIVEKISPRAKWSRGATGHASLLKSVGAIWASIGCEKTIEIAPRQWQSLAPDDWVKGDAEDARAMGMAVLTLLDIQEKK